jgi:hypothetical protein
MPRFIRITRADIRIGEGRWRSGAFRAAYVRSTDCNLTGPEHAHLDDAALLAEAVREARRMGIMRRPAPTRKTTP